VIGEVYIFLNEFFQWAKDNPQHATDYKGVKQLRLQLTRGKDGRPSLSVNTWKPKNETSSHGTTTRDGITTPDSDLPF
jgi:hypothetical protein